MKSLQSKSLWVALSTVCLLVAGCGQKGPLYLPEQPKPTVSAAPDVQPNQSQLSEQSQ